MRVLLVTHNYPPFGLAGVERVSEQTALSLAERGHDVTVLSKRESAAPPLPVAQRHERNGIEVITITGGGSTHGRFPKLMARVEALFERVLLELDPDVLLVSHLRGHSPAYLGIAGRWGIPSVLELHDFFLACERAHLLRRDGSACAGPEGGAACARHCFPEVERALDRFALRTAAFEAALSQAEAVIAPSRFVATQIGRWFDPGIPIQIIGNAVAFEPKPQPARLGDGPLHIAVPGIVAEHKGPHVVIEALGLARLPAVRLTLFGAPIQPYAMGLRAAAAGVAGLKFRSYGAFEPRELPFLLGDVDLVVVPSLAPESYSLAAREALALGIPVIASRAGALPEAVRDGDNGLLFEPGASKRLAAILQLLDADRPRLQRLRAGISSADWVSSDDRAAAIEAVLADTVAGARARSTRSGPTGLAVLGQSLLGQLVAP